MANFEPSDWVADHSVPSSLYDGDTSSDCSSKMTLVDDKSTVKLLSPAVESQTPNVGGPRIKKRRVDFNLTIDIKQESDLDDACVPQGPHSLSEFSGDGDWGIGEQIPTTPGGKPQVG